MSGGIALKILPDGNSLQLLLNQVTPINKAFSVWFPIGITTFDVWQMIMFLSSSTAAVELRFEFAFQNYLIPTMTNPVNGIFGINYIFGNAGQDSKPVIIPRFIPASNEVWMRFKNLTSNAAVTITGGLTVCN